MGSGKGTSKRIKVSANNSKVKENLVKPPRQITVVSRGKGELDISHFKKIKNNEHHQKPRGGLWTCPAQANGSSGYIDLFYGDMDEDNKKQLKEDNRIYEFNPGVHNLLVINTAEDIVDVMNKYGGAPNFWEKLGGFPDEVKGLNIIKDIAPPSKAWLDWEKIAEDYEGCWMTADGHAANRELDLFEQNFNHINSPFYAWDFESILWFNFPEDAELEEII